MGCCCIRSSKEEAKNQNLKVIDKYNVDLMDKKPGPVNNLHVKDFIPVNRDPKSHIQDIIDVQAVFKASKIHDTVSQNVNKRDKEIFWAQNICRVYPHFAAELMEDYKQFFFDKVKIKQADGVNLRTEEGPNGVQDAIKACKKQKSLKPLIWSDDVYKASKGHCESQIQNNKVGPVGVDGLDLKQRIRKYSDSPFKIGEICVYSKSSPFGIITGLIIDDGKKDRRNRKHVFNESLMMCALHYEESESFHYGGCCIIDYTTFSQPKNGPNVKDQILIALNAQVDPQLEELKKRHGGGSWRYNYNFDINPPQVHLPFESPSGKTTNLTGTLDIWPLLYPNIIEFDP